MGFWVAYITLVAVCTCSIVYALGIFDALLRIAKALETIGAHLARRP